MEDSHAHDMDQNANGEPQAENVENEDDEIPAMNEIEEMAQDHIEREAENRGR